MYLHENKELFKATINEVEKTTGVNGEIIEKDYYVTMVLQALSEKQPECVFKGGTSLSKGFKLINRFSEDIDITFSEHIGKERRKHLKNDTIKGISEELNLPIENWNETESNKDLNSYHLIYDSVYDTAQNIKPVVKLETSLGSSAFPTTTRSIGSCIGDYLKESGHSEIARQYNLEEFPMTLQSLERTYIDKIFAIADYYMQNRSKRCSRHLYDIKKLNPVVFKEKESPDFAETFRKVREHRQEMNARQKAKGKTKLICPSAEPNRNLPDTLMQICDTDFYKKDYETTTSYLINDAVSYENTISQIRDIADELYHLPEYSKEKTTQECHP